MILKELQEFVLDYHRVSLAEMELHFHMDGNALRQMLNKLIKKGRVLKVPTPDKCHGCTSCDPDTMEFYEWIDGDNSEPAHFPKSLTTKAQIHSIELPEASESPRIKYAVILHNYSETKEAER